MARLKAENNNSGSNSVKNTINIALISLASVGLPAHAETLCQRISDNYAATGYWSRDCGPEPGKPYAAELKKDCAQTAQQIAARPGASWNSEFGWVLDWQCEAADKI
jgi:hypothetical protein